MKGTSCLQEINTCHHWNLQEYIDPTTRKALETHKSSEKFDRTFCGKWEELPKQGGPVDKTSRPIIPTPWYELLKLCGATNQFLSFYQLLHLLNFRSSMAYRPLHWMVILLESGRCQLDEHSAPCHSPLQCLMLKFWFLHSPVFSHLDNLSLVARCLEIKNSLLPLQFLVEDSIFIGTNHGIRL